MRHRTLVEIDCSTCSVVDTVARVTIRIVHSYTDIFYSRGSVFRKDDMGVETRRDIDMPV